MQIGESKRDRIRELNARSLQNTQAEAWGKKKDKRYKKGKKDIWDTMKKVQDICDWSLIGKTRMQYLRDNYWELPQIVKQH